MNSNISILIPARGGSKRIKNKNVVIIDGKPLIAYCLEQALKITKNVFVSTDCDKIKKACKPYDVTVIDRPIHLAGDKSDVRDTIKHFLSKNDCEILILMQATSPLVQSEHVLEGIDKMKKYDSVISVYETKSFFWDVNNQPINYDPLNKPRTQDMNPVFVENGAFYITKKENFIKNNILTNGNVGFVTMPENLSIDIDNEKDLKMFKFMLKYTKNE